MQPLKILHHVGSFKCTSGHLIVSDPCYGTPTPDTHSQEILKARKGDWDAYIEYDNDNHVTNRLIAKHAPASFVSTPAPIHLDDYMIAVDSGQAGFFDAEHFHLCNNDLYELICDITLNKKHNAGCLDFGAVSESGYGDGCYELSVTRNKDGEVILASIDFLCDNDED